MDDKTGRDDEGIFDKNRIEGMFDGPILRVLTRLALPMFAGMVFQVLYSIVDTIWISRIDLKDPSYVGGTGMIFPLIFLIIALGSGILIGVSSLVARSIGEKNRHVLDKTAESGLFIGGTLSILFVSLAYIFDKKLVAILGATGDYYTHALEYLRFMIPAGALMLVGNVFNGILQGEGLMGKIMKAMIIATLVNIFLDPLCIFVLGLGVRGAGLATVIAQLIAAVYVLGVFFRKKTLVTIEWKLRNVNKTIIKKIIAVGFPQTAGQMTMAVSFLFFNRLVVGIDPLALTAFALYGRFDQTIIFPILAIGAAMITMIGQNFGRRLYKRVIDIWWTGILTAMGVIVFLGTLLFIFAPKIYPFFTDVEGVERYAVLQTRIIVYSWLLACFTVLGRASFQAVGRAIPGMIVVILRIVGIALPAAYFYVYVLHLGIYGVWFGIITGSAVAAVVSGIWVRRTLLGFIKKEEIKIPLDIPTREGAVAE